ncbi:MAG: hypothetical protein ACW99L_03500 [Promethearchaeota archaeon]|jgi:hypothetical protein
MYIVAETWFPAKNASEVGKLYLEMMAKYPDDRSIAKPIIQSSIHSVKDGIHALGVSSIKPGKVKEAMDLYSNRLLMMASIEGYVYEIYVTYDVVEAMPLVGLQAPPE